MKVSLRFLWYDMWVGAYWDRASRTLYLCPLPMVVIKIEMGPECHCRSYHERTDKHVEDCPRFGLED